MNELNIQWKVEKRKVKDLKEWSKNPRRITGEEYEHLKNQIKTYGFHDVLKIDLDGTIISGHQRKRALLEMNIDEINVMIPDRALTEKEREVVALASNLHRGDFDFDILANQFDELNLIEAGFDKKDLNFFNDTSEDDFDVGGALGNAAEPKSKRGDLYQLGKHFVLCGDSTLKEDVEKLMDGKKADMV